MRSAVSLFALLTTLGLFVGEATAQAPRAADLPPGNAGIDQFTEAVPSVTGMGSPSLRAMDNAPTPFLDAQSRAGLEALGPDGETVADILDATAPGESNFEPPHLRADNGTPVVEVIRAAVIGGRHGGGALPVALLALVPVVLLRVRRHRSAADHLLE